MNQQRVLRILGLTGMLLYVGLATGILHLGETMTLTLSVLIAPLAIAGVVAFHRKLSADDDSASLRIGTVLLVCGFVVFGLMTLVQQAAAASRHAALAATIDATGRTAVTAAFAAVNSVQLGADVAFDVFYGTGMLFLAAALVRWKRRGVLLALSGSVLALLLLGLNLATFPTPPAEAGLVDAGPWTILWWLLVVAVRPRVPPRAILEAGTLPQ